MKPLPETVWVFVDPDGVPCLVQISDPRADDFVHFKERAARFRLVQGTERAERDCQEGAAMARRRGYTVNLPCTHQGCRAFSHHEADTRAEEASIRAGTGKWWKCDEHRALDERLTQERPEIVTRLVNGRSARYPQLTDFFWGDSSGYQHGPGFHARSRDWPEGAVLEVTARVILPATHPIGTDKPEGQRT